MLYLINQFVPYTLYVQYSTVQYYIRERYVHIHNTVLVYVHKEQRQSFSKREKRHIATVEFGNQRKMYFQCDGAPKLNNNFIDVPIYIVKHKSTQSYIYVVIHLRSHTSTYRQSYIYVVINLRSHSSTQSYIYVIIHLHSHTST